MNTIVVPSRMTPDYPYTFTPDADTMTYIVIDTERWKIAGIPPMVEPLTKDVTIDHQGLRINGVLFSDDYTFTFAIGVEDAGNAFARR